MVESKTRKTGIYKKQAKYLQQYTCSTKFKNLVIFQWNCIIKYLCIKYYLMAKYLMQYLIKFTVPKYYHLAFQIQKYIPKMCFLLKRYFKIYKLIRIGDLM